MGFDGNIWVGGLLGVLVVFGPAYIVYVIAGAIAGAVARARAGRTTATEPLPPLEVRRGEAAPVTTTAA